MKKRKYGIIYLIRNKINNKIYIGQTTLKGGFDERYNKDLGNNTHNEHLKRSIQKYGINNFEIDKEFDIAYSKEELDKLECMYISLYNATNSKYGYNNMSGGAYGKHSVETKKKMSKIRKDIWKEENYRQKQIETHKGEKGYNFGKQLSKDTKKKISKINSIVIKKQYENGRVPYFLGKPMHKNTQDALLKANQIKIICITTMYIFDSISKASEFYTLDISGVAKCCKGKRKTCGKLPNGTPLKWMYYEEYIKQNQLLIHNNNLVQAI